MRTGIVYLVGAGPGDPGLVTLRAVECLREADVVVYDRLVSPVLLTHVSPGARLIYAGKEPGGHSHPQSQTNRQLAELALAGNTVCRLKGGDPFVFGRGGEEAELLVDMGIPFEVVPGVTSGIAAPAYAGIPVTHRDVTGAVTLVTGHEAPVKGGPTVDLDAMGKIGGTLLIYMGVEGLGRTAEALITAGRAPTTPVAVIRLGTRAEQETLTGTLATIAAQVKLDGMKPPAMVVVGEVVHLRARLAWAERRPLFGHRILVPIEMGTGSSSLIQQFKQQGAEVWEWPVPRFDLEPVLRGALQDRLIDTVAFPSPRTVTALISMLGGTEALRGLEVVCADAQTARFVEAAGLMAVEPRG